MQLHRMLSLQIVLAITLTGCVPSEKSRVSATTTPSYFSFAINKLYDDFSCQTNRDSSYVFCITGSKSTAENPLHVSRFFVYDIGAGQMLLEDSVVGGTVRWTNDHEIEVTKTPGIIPDEEHAVKMITGYIYDVRSRTKRSRGDTGAISP